MSTKICEVDNPASEIYKCHNDNTKMYQAIKFINRKPLQNFMVHEKAGRNVTEPNTVYNIIRDQFKAKESKLEKFIGNPTRLDTPITKCEVAQSIRKLRNNRAPEYDQITTEILKYAPTESHDLIAESFNNIFPKHEYINVGHGLLTALQKGRSTSNILWCHRFLAARVQNVQEGIMVTGIDMILPFDTTERTKLTEIVQ